MATTAAMPRVCIMGCGRVGAKLAQYFRNKRYEVQVIDINNDAFLRLDEKTFRDHNTTLGDGTDPGVLERAGVPGAAIFIAVTNGDNRNIMAVQIAKYQFGVQQVICRIYDPKRHEIYHDKLGITSICPTEIGADSIIFELTGERISSDHYLQHLMSPTPVEEGQGS